MTGGTADAATRFDHGAEVEVTVRGRIGTAFGYPFLCDEDGTLLTVEVFSKARRAGNVRLVKAAALVPCDVVPREAAS